MADPHWKSAAFAGAHGIAATLLALAFDHGNPPSVRRCAIVAAIAASALSHLIHTLGRLIDPVIVLQRIWTSVVATLRAHLPASTTQSSQPKEPS